MENLKFSVSMCTYRKDNPEWFRIAVESILNGTVKPDEVVLVVDGPVPNELNIVINEYEINPIFKVIRLEKNMGLGNALRVAVENCTYELIARMDSDDISLPNRFEQQLAYFKKDDELDVLSGDIVEFISDENQIVSRRSLPIPDIEIKKDMKKRCSVNHPAVMLKKTSVLSVGNYIDWFFNEDYYLWIRMMKNGCKFNNTGTILVKMRIGKDMYDRRGGMKYFKSETKLQKYMLDNKIIGFGTFLENVTKRFIVQVLLPNKIRGWVFKKFARER